MDLPFREGVNKHELFGYMSPSLLPLSPLGDKGEDPQTIMFFFQLSNHNCFTPSPTGFPILWPVALARQRKLYFYLELNQLLKELDHRLKLQGPRDTNPETSHCKKRNIEK